MKIGILGGTFDPIHAGHLAVGERAAEFFGLDQVILMVARAQPQKQHAALASPWHRFAMAVLATESHPLIHVSDWELQRPGPSYTVDTLKAWRDADPGHEICFIAGSDSLNEIHMWKDYATLLTGFCFLFVRRPGVDIDFDHLALPRQLRQRLTNIQQQSSRLSIESGRSFVLPSSQHAVSSTEIRRALAQGRKVKTGVLSPQVLKHIRKYRLYERSDTETG